MISNVHKSEEIKMKRKVDRQLKINEHRPSNTPSNYLSPILAPILQHTSASALEYTYVRRRGRAYSHNAITSFDVHAAALRPGRGSTHLWWTWSWLDCIYMREFPWECPWKITRPHIHDNWSCKVNVFVQQWQCRGDFLVCAHSSLWKSTCYAVIIS